MTLEIRWIEDLLALDQEKSISKAAALRHVTQSAFTRRIQNIEEALGFQILKRYSKSIDFTDAGQVLLSTSKNIKNQMNTTINYLEKNIKDNELSSFLKIIKPAWASFNVKSEYLLQTLEIKNKKPLDFGIDKCIFKLLKL